MTLRAEARVDLGAIERNCARLTRALTGGALLCAVVKADGYGHGAVPAARAALAGGGAGRGGGAARRGAAGGKGAAARRGAGIAAGILVMGALSPEELEIALRARAEIV